MFTVIEWTQSKKKWFCKVKCKLTYLRRGKVKLLNVIFLEVATQNRKEWVAVDRLVRSKFLFFLSLVFDLKKKKVHIKAEKWLHSDGNAETLETRLSAHTWQMI